MYSGFNTILRDKLISYSTPDPSEPGEFDNFSSFIYRSENLPIYFSGEWELDDGPHVRVRVFSNEPDPQSTGGSPEESVSGYIRLGIFLPATDKGLDYSLNDLASQVHSDFPVSDFIDGDYKVEWTGVARGDEVRIDGHYTITMQANYNYYFCN